MAEAKIRRMSVLRPWWSASRTDAGPLPSGQRLCLLGQNVLYYVLRLGLAVGWIPSAVSLARASSAQACADYHLHAERAVVILESSWVRWRIIARQAELSGRFGDDDPTGTDLEESIPDAADQRTEASTRQKEWVGWISRVAITQPTSVAGFANGPTAWSTYRNQLALANPDACILPSRIASIDANTFVGTHREPLWNLVSHDQG